MQNTPLRAGPKPKNIVSVCIDEINEELVAGRMYHCYSESPVLFSNQLQLITEMETLYDRLNFPSGINRDRTTEIEKGTVGKRRGGGSMRMNRT